MAKALGPESRITAIAPTPGAVANAAMVSCKSIGNAIIKRFSGFGVSGFLVAALNHDHSLMPPLETRNPKLSSCKDAANISPVFQKNRFTFAPVF